MIRNAVLIRSAVICLTVLCGAAPSFAITEAECPGMVVRSAKTAKLLAADAVAVVDPTTRTMISSVQTVGRDLRREFSLTRAPRAGDRVYVYCRGYEIGTGVYAGKVPGVELRLVSARRKVVVKPADPALAGAKLLVNLGLSFELPEVGQRMHFRTSHRIRFTQDEPWASILMPSEGLILCQAKIEGRPNGLVWPEFQWLTGAAPEPVGLRLAPFRTVRVRIPPDLRSRVHVTLLPQFAHSPAGAEPALAEAILYHLFSRSIGPPATVAGQYADVRRVPLTPASLVCSVGGRETIVEIDAQQRLVDLAKDPPSPAGVVTRPLVLGEAVRAGTIVIAGRVDLTALLRLSGDLRMLYPTLSATVREGADSFTLAASDVLTVWHKETGLSYVGRQEGVRPEAEGFMPGACHVKWKKRPGFTLRIAVFPFWHGTGSKDFATPDDRLWMGFDGAVGEGRIAGLAPGEYLCIVDFWRGQKNWRVFHRFKLGAEETVKEVLLDG